MNDDQLLRYSRQIMLPEFDYAGQQALLDARVLVIGVGGLGSPVAMYLAAAGVGHLVLVDDDVVDFSNLQRQIVHTEQTVDQLKVDSAATSIARLNSDIKVTCLPQRLAGKALEDQVKAADVVVDCSDNLTTRSALNQVCWRIKTPLVSGAAIRFEGQLSVFDSRHADSPCYACLHHQTGSLDATCAANGVISPVVGIIGAMQALETVKLLAQVGEPAIGKLMLFDGLAAQWRSFGLPKLPGCQVCGAIE
ncbi:MAG: molybdopterin-synthase adenylyltransferase MoeB [Gammaproteobacteria bacterium]|jgi:adenylyltransferase/sulfurtransferase|nr:molybdopterin-synthase adenylyltransferase MoeB [Gammaproteobacteria bacterium]